MRRLLAFFFIENEEVTVTIKTEFNAIFHTAIYLQDQNVLFQKMAMATLRTKKLTIKAEFNATFHTAVFIFKIKISRSKMAMVKNFVGIVSKKACCS